MEQRKMGSFLRTLRKERNLTQEQLAEQFNVSSRTVSRWETGSNAPDPSTLIEIADFYQVDVREIIDGERKRKDMDSETRDTLKKVAAYGDAEKDKVRKHINSVMSAAMILLLFSLLLDMTEGFGFIPARPCQNMSNLAVGLTLVGFALNLLHMNGTLDRIGAWLGRSK